MNKIALLMIFILLFISCPVNASAVSAQYACVMNAQTGRVLYEKNGYQIHSMASTTKIMTALVALECAHPDEVVTVSKNAAGTEGSSMYLAAGEKIPLKDLLYGLMLASGNDAAIAIAEHVGGSVENFATMMTDRAREIGAKNTGFINPNGLDAEGHHTTAYDLALITREALKNPVFCEIVSTKRKSTSGDNGSTVRTFVNHNKLLSLYNGCIGVKTGFTKKTGRCLVSAATRDHMTLICVTLNAPNDWSDHTTLLDHAFQTTKSRPLVMKDMILKTLPVKNGSAKTVELLAAEDFYMSFLNEEELTSIKLDYTLPSHIPAPVTTGAKIGKLTIRYDDAVLAEIDLLSAVDIDYIQPPTPNFWVNFQKIFQILLKFNGKVSII